jgi:threonine dehydrogenase-like Zn-dependent dehydrogenase
MKNTTDAGQMRAASIVGPGAVEVIRVARPEPSAQQVRIRLEGCGVCGSNLALWEGRPWFKYPPNPGEPGHEGWGVVESVGSEAPRELIGKRVAALSYRAFAEFDVAEASQVVPLPAALDGQLFPGEALGCVMNIYRRSEIERDQWVAIVGAGFLGTLLVQMAARAGARVLAISRRRAALDAAERAGATEGIVLDDWNEIERRVRERTGGRGCERVIEAVGEQGPLDLASKLVAERGKLIIAGYHQDRRQVDMQSWNWRGIDVINAHERSPEVYVRGIREAVDAVAQGLIDPKPLYTHTVPLEELGSALTALKTRPGNLIKGCVTL